MYNSEADTLKHIKRVNSLLIDFSIELLNRAKIHDDSKLLSPEKELFDRYTPILKELTYNGEAYNKCLNVLKPALDHHYANNSHHPQYYKHGIDDMTLFDIVEMFVDWKAATERTKNGSMSESILQNKERFKMSDQLEFIFQNTVDKLKY